MPYKYYWITIYNEETNLPVFRKVRGIPVAVDGFKDYEFFVNKDPKEDKLFNFSEALTGWGVVLQKNTEQEAIESGIAILKEKGVAFVNQKLIDTIKITGVTPYYNIKTEIKYKEECKNNV
jgi:hypothetical protein